MAGTLSRLLYHVVFSTKQRSPFIEAGLRARLYPYIEGVVRRQGGWLLAIGGVADHVHLLLRLKPDMPVSYLVQCIKGASSKWVHEQPGLSLDFGWQLGYAAFSVSASSEDIVRAYINNQEQHHSRSTFQQELLVLKRKHGVEQDVTFRTDTRPEGAELE